MDNLKLLGSLFRATVDSEGEWKVTFVIPRNNGVEVAKLTALTEQVFNIDISLAEK